MDGGGKLAEIWREAATIALTLALGLAHLVGSAWLSYQLFRLAGGVVEDGLWTHYGGIEYAWTNLAWLPGGLLLFAGPGGGAIGLLMMFAGSVVAGSTAAVALVWPRWGRMGWRVWLPLLLWFGWLPVPVQATLTYWHTVAY